MWSRLFGVHASGTQAAAASSTVPGAPPPSIDAEAAANDEPCTALMARPRPIDRLRRGSTIPHEATPPDRLSVADRAEAAHAHARVPERMDRQAADAAALSACRQARELLEKRRDAVDAAASAATASSTSDGRHPGTAAAFARHAGALRAHEEAAQAAVDAAWRATQAHRALADLTADAIDARHLRRDAEAAAADQRAIVREAEAHCLQAEGRLRRNGQLPRAAANASEAHEAAIQHLLRATHGAARGRRGPLVVEAEERLSMAIARVESTHGELEAQRQQVLAARTARDAARQALESLERDAALAADTSAALDARMAPSTERAGMADHEAAQARRDRDALQDAADTAMDRLEQALSDACEDLRRPTAPRAPAPASRGARLADALRRPFDGLRLRIAPVKVDFALGPLGAAVGGTTPTADPDAVRATRRPTEATSARAVAAIDRKTADAAKGVAGLLSKGARGAASHANTPATLGSAVAFTAEIGRMFPGRASGLGRATPGHSATPADTRLAMALLDQPRGDATTRPDGHPLRHEQALLVASALRTVTADPSQALRIHAFLRRDPPLALSHLAARAASHAPATDTADTADTADMAGTDAADIERMANTVRRSLASTEGGFRTLLDLQGIALPAESLGPDARRHAERAFEYHKLGLRAEEALLTLGLRVGGTQSTADIRRALDEHPERARWLDPARLGTGNARRRPGGPRDAEHPATLPAQAFLHAADNLRTRLGAADARPELKPAYVALRNGFTESGQGSDFHLMAKRLRKFITYIDLACKTPEGRSATALDKVRSPVHAVRRLLGKDKSPLTTLLRAGPLGSDLPGLSPDGKAGAGASGAAAASKDEFARAAPAGRREILRKMMVAAVAGNDGTSYTDGRRYGFGALFGYGVASVSGIGGLTTGVTPVGEVNLDLTRAAVFKAGVAPTTGMIFLGSERKWTGSIGVGVRAGAELGPAVNATAQAMARLGGSHLVSKGLMIRTKRDTGLAPAAAAAAGSSSKNWNPASQDVVEAIFQIADQPAASRPAHGGAMWSQMVDKVGDLSTVSFGWNQGRTRTVDASVSLDGTLSVGLGAGVGFSAVGGVGLKRTLFNKSESRDTAGAGRQVQVGSASRTVLGIGASVGIGHPSFKTPSGSSVSLFGRHKVGVETEVTLQSTSGSVRIVTENGKVRPGLSFKHREFGVRDDFIKLLNTQRETWAARLGERDADGRLRGGGSQLDDFLHRLVNLPPGPNRLYIERQCLTTEAADAINACMDRIAVLQRPPQPGAPRDPDRQELVAALRGQIAALSAESSSWQPFKLVVNETVQSNHERGLGADARDTPASRAQSRGGAPGFAERFLGGGRVTLGSHVGTALGGRDLLTLLALPRQA